MNDIVLFLVFFYNQSDNIVNIALFTKNFKFCKISVNGLKVNVIYKSNLIGFNVKNIDLINISHLHQHQELWLNYNRYISL